MNRIIIHSWRRAVTLSVFISLLAPVSSFAQGDTLDFDQTQVVKGTRQLSVDNALKISELPSFHEADLTMPDIRYQLIPIKREIEVPIDTIEPARLRLREALDKLYRNYAKAGIGTYLTPYFEFRHNSLRSRDWIYNVHARHMSSNKGIKNVGYSGYSDNELRGNVTRILRDHSLSGELFYERNVVHNYGFDPQDLDIDDDRFKQTYSRFGGEVGFMKFQKDSAALNYRGDIAVKHVSNRYSASETNVLFESRFEKYIENFYGSVNFDLDINSYKSKPDEPYDWIRPDSLNAPLVEAANNAEETSVNNGIVRIEPELLKQGENWQVMVGLGIQAFMDNTADFHFFPRAEASYSLFDDLFIPYARLDGNVQRNSYYGITTENPFMLSQVGLAPTIEKYRFTGGIRGTISKAMSFNAFVSLSNRDDQLFYVNDTVYSSENRFDLVYDDLRELSFGGDIDYDGEKLDVSAGFTYFIYSTDDQEEAWHLPPYRLDLSARYNLYDKLIVGVEVGAEGKRFAKSLLPVPDVEAEPEGYSIVELDGFIDLTLRAEYRYTSRLSVFLEGSNLFADKYQRYYRFPVQRALILGGLTYSF